MALFQSAFLLSILLLSLSSSLIQASDINYCNNKANYDVKVNGVEISPYPVSRGVDTIFSISASTGEAISEGKLMIDVSYFGFHIYSETDDICSKTSCPVSAGDFVVSHSQSLPIFTPPGTYSLTMKMEDGNKRQLTCIHFDFSIGFGATEAALAADM
ncbi:putative phosphatidylglycerol/phosphatidylinositol transfer protein DDB_G0282179 [Impatiens glandulifera]|uniref:putative phosphatidylglycerol/phosphatidylinositol transfer protein DDB_G0282179 n=1 Tax=Impatiens glandulifera TaxID=253017 RepID=UPI001FB187DE|nr:putative phosphatidylglycerol/phosphatidylinositol transfer protein DDB_G0282179 [Impatiens glandulifera]